MKILFATETCGYLGGAEQIIADAAQGLRQRGHVSYLVYGRTTQAELDKFKRFFEMCMPCKDLSSSDVGSAPSFGQVVDCISPDVIFLHRVQKLPFDNRTVPKIRIVRMVVDHEIYCPRRSKLYLWTGTLCRHKADWRCWLDAGFLTKDRASPFGLRVTNLRRMLAGLRENHNLDAILAISNHVQQELLENGFPKEKVCVLHPVPRMEPSSFAVWPKVPRVLYVGQLIRGKGVDLFLRALKKISGNFMASVVGTGNAATHLEHLCLKLGLTKKVEFTGHVSHDNLGSYYSASSVVVVPSRWPEPFGMVGLEAMLHGRPVVAFNVGGISEWLEDGITGLLVPERNVSKLAMSLERILSDPDFAARLGRQALHSFRRRFSFEHYIEQLESHLSGKGQNHMTENDAKSFPGTSPQ